MFIILAREKRIGVTKNCSIVQNHLFSIQKIDFWQLYSKIQEYKAGKSNDSFKLVEIQHLIAILVFSQSHKDSCTAPTTHVSMSSRNCKITGFAVYLFIST